VTVAAEATLETVFEDDALRIRFERADSDEAVVSFSGVGAEEYVVPQDRRQIDEFRKSFGGIKNVYYVVDKCRRWYNHGLEKIIIERLNPHIARSKFTRVAAIGHSMGGTGALLFASRIRRCRQALAFAPQSSVHPDFAPFETRWRPFTSAITDWTIPDPIAAMTDDIRYYVFYGADDAQDEQHARRMMERNLRKLTVFAIEGCRHDVAMFLKNQGVFKHLVIQANTGRMCDIRTVLEAVPHRAFLGREK
jgi:hypothetical protein